MTTHASHRVALLSKPGDTPTAFTPDAVLRVLLEEGAKRQLTPQQLATSADLPYSAAHKLLNHQARRPTLETAAALAAALGLHFEVRDGNGRRIA
jgi:plasmid maintenance system antidote protein VapI